MFCQSYVNSHARLNNLPFVRLSWNLLCSLIGHFQLVNIVKFSHLIGKLMTVFDLSFITIFNPKSGNGLSKYVRISV